MFSTTLAILFLAFGIFSAGHALLLKRDPRSALGWFVVCLIVPGLGALGYWFLGVNRIRSKARRWRARGRMHFFEWACEHLGEDVTFPPHLRRENFFALRSLSDAVTRRHLVQGNKLTLLHNGDEAYPAMLAAIEGAQHSVYLSSYIFADDRSGQSFCDALQRAAARGVDVRVLVDALGEKYFWPPIHWRLRRLAIRHARFLPFSLSSWGFFINLRNHRKLLIVDNSLGFTGGMNISDRHLLADPALPHRVVDLHFQIAGPVVGQMQEAFFEDWYFATGEVPQKPLTAPRPLTDGESFCRGISAGPNEDFEPLTWIIVGALNSARKRVCIMTPYFIPDRALTIALCAAALRGVEVEIILPKKSNLPFVSWASQDYLAELVENKVRIFYQPAPFVHSKMLIMDHHYALIGSANIDPRSLRLNFEFNIEIFDQAGTCAALLAYFDAARAVSDPVTAAKLKALPLWMRLRNSFMKIFSPYL
jgi:cardiolipin synthase